MQNGGETVNLTDLIDRIWRESKDKGYNIRKQDIETIMKIFVEEVRDGLIEHGKIKIHNLLSLYIKKNRGRRIRNFQGELMHTDDYYKISVKPSAVLKDKIEKYNK